MRPRELTVVQGKHLPLVSVAVVNFNGGTLVTAAVRAVLDSTVPIEVFVADNGSTDGSLDPLRSVAESEPRLQLIENGHNLGFTRATNLCLERSKGDFLLLLNPDCVVEADTLERMVDIVAQDPEVGMAGCLIRNPDGSEQAGCRRAVPTPWRTLVRMLHLNRLFPTNPRFRTFLLNQEPLPLQPVPVEVISGAFMLVRREAMQQVGLLDEGYFLHCDDIDWCMRFSKHGWKILFVPGVEVVHNKGACSRDRPIRVEWHKHLGMMRFYRKFFRAQYPIALMGLVAFGVWTHFTLLAAAHAMRHTSRFLGIARG